MTENGNATVLVLVGSLRAASVNRQLAELAAEAAKRAIRYVYEDLGWSTAMSLIEPANEASIRLATRLGASFERDYLDHGWNARIYRHLPPTRFLQEAA